MADTAFIVSMSTSSLLMVLLAGYLYYKDQQACKYVKMWENNDMTGTLYCAKPGTVPSDLPFIPQSFSVPAGHSMDLVGVSSIGSRHLNVVGGPNTVTGLSPPTTSIISLAVA